MARDPYRYFRIEARELLDQLGKAALDLEGSAAPGEPLARLLRLAHTLKGAARVVKLAPIADRAHALEGTLAPYRRDGGQGGDVPREQVDRALALIDEMDAELGKLPAEPGARKDETGPAPAKPAAQEPVRTVRTDVHDVDALLQGIAEVQGELAALRKLASTPALARGVERAERELNEIRVLGERLRLVPAGTLFNALERLARDSARAAGKAVEFAASGAEVRMDGAVLDAIQPALVQLVRNAVAHGIEPESERSRAGKRPAGTVAIEVIRRGPRTVFRCRDDGRGIDLEAVESALRSRGVLPEGARLGTADLLSLLLKGGLSTAATVTDLSGRGIGLDVVREATERLGGEISVETAAGAGTTVDLSVPVSLTSFPALIGEVSEARAAFPLDMVAGARRVTRSEIVQLADGEGLEHEGRLVPLAKLARWLAASHGARRRGAVPGGAQEAFTVVFVRSGDRVLAVVIDRLVGVQDILLRPVPALAPLAPIVAGVCLDADGNPMPVVAPEALGGPGADLPAGEAPAAAMPILVIDDSLTTRMLEQSILESAGYSVELATSAEEGLEMARRREYGLFVCDVEMPGMDGFAFVERSRADPALRQVPCMLVTSRSSPEDRRRAEAAGASGYIVKGEFDQGVFLDRVARLIRQ